MDPTADSQTNVVVKVQLSDIMHYASGGTRLIVEGERVFQANHLLLVGIEMIYDDGIKLFASCLKSSAPSSEPHKICIRTRSTFTDWSFECSCKAGLGKCKHVAAVLNYLLLYPSVPLLTATDLQQKWGKVAKKVAGDMYKATRLKEFCGKSQSEDNYTGTVILSEEETADVLKLFEKNFPESSLFYELNGRPNRRETAKQDTSVSSVIRELFDTKLDLNTSCRSLSSESLISVDENSKTTSLKKFLNNAFDSNRYTETDVDLLHFIGPLDADLSIFYEVQICVSKRESLQICLDTVEQRVSGLWKTERTRRITASNAYSLYTYYSSQNDKIKNWKKKIINLIDPREINTSAVAHGIRCESLALNAYARDFGKIVIKCGFVIPPHIPWIGCSPDGIVLSEKKVIEVKCPEKGKTLHLTEMLEGLSYLTKNTKALKRNHQYYAQIQINMFILKCIVADFVIYSEFEDKCYVQTIPYDEEFVQKVLVVLKEVFFNAFLKILFTTCTKGS